MCIYIYNYSRRLQLQIVYTITALTSAAASRVGTYICVQVLWTLTRGIRKTYAACMSSLFSNYNTNLYRVIHQSRSFFFINNAVIQNLIHAISKCTWRPYFRIFEIFYTYSTRSVQWRCKLPFSAMVILNILVNYINLLNIFYDSQK